MTRGTLAAAAAAALVLGGCGSSERLTKPQYEHKVRSVYASLRSSFLATNVGLPQLSGKVAAAQEELRTTAEELEKVEPPRTIEKEHEELVEGLRKYADDLDKLRAAARRGDGAAIENFTANIGQNTAIEQIAEAAEEMKLKGFDLGRLAKGD